MNIDFGWVLILAGLAGALPTGKALLSRHKRTRTRWLRLIVHLLLVIVGILEVQQHRNWHPFRQLPASQPSAPIAHLQGRPASTTHPPQLNA